MNCNEKNGVISRGNGKSTLTIYKLLKFSGLTKDFNNAIAKVKIKDEYK